MRVIKTKTSDHNTPRIQLPLNEMPVVITKTADRVDRKVALPTMEGIHFERIERITSLEAQGNYTMLFFTDGKQLLVCKTLQDIETMIHRSYQFVRIHRSFTINLNQLQRYVRGKGGYVIMENGSTVNVSAGRKQAFLEAVGAYFGGE